MADKVAKPITVELAPPEDGTFGATGRYTDALRQNPDTVLAARGVSLTVYDELLRDDQVRSTLQQRRTALVEAEWQVEPASESSADKAVADFITEQLKAARFDAVTDMMAYGVFYGWAVAECMWAVDGSRVVLDSIRVRERDRFGYTTRGDLLLLTNAAPQGIRVPDRKFWSFSAGASHSDNPYGLGLAHSLYWPVFFKRNGIKFWLIFLEKFGMPTAVAKLPGGQVDNVADRQRALAVLKQIQTDAGIVVPESMVIELLEAARSGTADYDALCRRMDEAISKVVLSQTMTTDDGSSLSQAKVHAGVAAAVVKSDADLICDSLNRSVVRWLTEWNFPGAKPPRVWRSTEPPEDLNARAERDTKIVALGYEPTEEYIAETYGPGWKKRPPQPVVAPGPDGAMGAEFAEITRLAQQRVDHRADQQALVDAAAYLATKYRDLYGGRVDQLLNYLEETGDPDTFRKRITEMLAEVPAPAAVDTVQRANLFARLMGRLRGER